MTDPLDTLRPEVREALRSIEFACTVRYSGEDEYAIIRAELLRLAEDAAMFAHAVSLGQRYKQRAEHAEAELAALRARIEGAPLTTFRRAMLGTPHAWVEEKFACPEWIGKRVRLVVEE